MNAILRPVGFYSISNRPATVATWTTRTDQHRSAGNSDYLDSLARLQGKGCPTSGPNQEDHRIRCEAIGRYGTRGTFAGLVEALKCAFGRSTDGKFGDYVIEQRQKVMYHCQQILSNSTHEKDNQNEIRYPDCRDRRHACTSDCTAADQKV